jgi:imidazolonepropionase-like amidohydrolase
MRILIVLLLLLGTLPLALTSQSNSTIAFTNGRWFDGETFQDRTVYSIDGSLSFARPARIDRTVDLAGTWVIPPFAEAHNHNIDGFDETRSAAALRRYIADGVFYVKIQGNYRLTDEQRRRLPINRPGAPDVVFAQAFLTASGGHPIPLHEEVLLRQGYYGNSSREALRDKVYITLDSERDLDAKWPEILSLHPDFIKANLWYSDEFERRRADPAFVGRRALDPELLPRLVQKAHAAGLRVSTHVVNVADFRTALTSGVDEIVHVPTFAAFPAVEARVLEAATNTLDESGIAQIAAALSKLDPANPGTLPLTAEDARQAAARGTVVITTMSPSSRAPAALRPGIRAVQAAALRLLRDQRVTLAVGSDNVGDTSKGEAEHLQSLGVLDNRALLTMWTETTARAIFPQRRIGRLQEGYEATFLALEGNPLLDWQQVRRIKFRFKQGIEVQP